MQVEELTSGKAAGQFMLYRKTREDGYRAWLLIGWWTWSEKNGICLLIPSFFFLINLFIYLVLAVLGLSCCVRAFSC